MNKIGFWETWNKDSGTIEKSNNRRNNSIALWVGLLLAILTVALPTITFGDGWPMVITLLSYSIGSSAYQKTIELAANKKKDV